MAASVVPKGYTTAAAVAAALGVALTPELTAAANDAIAAAEDAIDRYCADAWLLPSPVVGEWHRAGPDGVVYLERSPVTAVTAVRARYPYAGAQSMLLVALTDYELLDPAHGVLLVRPVPSGELLSVDYTHPSPSAVPPVVSSVCLEMAVRAVSSSAAGGAGSAPVASGIKRYSVGQELTVEYDTSAESSGSSASGGTSVPADLLAQLDAARLVRVVFA